METVIHTLTHSRSDRRRFINMPWTVYRENPNWVPHLKMDMHTMLNPKKHPFHDHAAVQLFLAVRDGTPVGRISAHVNHAHNEFWNDSVGFFGFFESIDDQEVADSLFAAAGEFLTQHGCSHIRGPLNWSTNEECGLLVDTFDEPPVIMMPYNPPYYPDLIEQNGFEKIKDLYAYQIQGAEAIPDRLDRGVKMLKKRYDFSLRPLDMKNFWDEVELIKHLYNEAWSANWGAVPMTDDEIEHLAKDLKLIVDPDLCFLAESDGKTVGFSVTLPDANQALIHTNGRLLPFGIFKLLWYMRKIDYVRVLLLGVLDSYRHHGIDVAMYHETFRRGMAKGINSGEMSWILEDNHSMRNAMDKMGGHIHKTYRIYQQAL